MKRISQTFCLLFILHLAGCTPPHRFDSTNETTITFSEAQMLKGLDTSDSTEFEQAIMYFKLGDQWRFLLDSPDDKEPDVVKNMQVIHGLTVEDILDRYRTETGKGLDIFESTD
jgi:hypothetical protein